MKTWIFAIFHYISVGFAYQDPSRKILSHRKSTVVHSWNLGEIDVYIFAVKYSAIKGYSRFPARQDFPARILVSKSYRNIVENCENPCFQCLGKWYRRIRSKKLAPEISFWDTIKKSWQIKFSDFFIFDIFFIDLDHKNL